MNATKKSLRLAEYIAQLKAGEVCQLPAAESPQELASRMAVPGRICEVTQATYYYYLGVLPPRLMLRGGFAFGEGADELRLFWRVDGTSFCRQLDAAENAEVCRMAGIPLSG